MRKVGTTTSAALGLLVAVSSFAHPDPGPPYGASRSFTAQAHSLEEEMREEKRAFVLHRIAVARRHASTIGVQPAIRPEMRSFVTER